MFEGFETRRISANGVEIHARVGGEGPPLLLVHGDSDVNVPKGESDQLFTALKMLGKEVEYVQIVGQDHHILDHEQRIVWNDTILAFLAKHLKGRSAWWDALYPEPKDWR